jgi:hypothetical protein
MVSRDLSQIFFTLALTARRANQMAPLFGIEKKFGHFRINRQTRLAKWQRLGCIVN